MADKTYTTRESGEAYIAANGPNGEPVFLTCYDIGDIAEDKGSINTLIQCFDGEGGWLTKAVTKNAPGPFSIDLGTYVGKRKELLSGNLCPATLYLFLRCGGKAGLFGNYDRGLVIDIGNVSTHTRTSWVSRNTDAAAEESFSAEGLPPVLELEKLRGRRVSMEQAVDFTGITFCNTKRCAGPCGGRKDICEDGFITTEALAGSPAAEAEILITHDGVTWTAGATPPFAAAENIVGQYCFALDATTTRHIVARGTTDAGAPAEIAYSDDDWATKVNVNLPTPNGQFVADKNAVYGIGKRIWIGTNAGYIVHSEDGGETWVAQESGSIQAGIYHSIFFEDVFSGMATAAGDVVVVTSDGGEVWSVATPTVNDGDLLTNHYNGLFWWIGTDDGELFYSDDFGETWTQRTAWFGSGTGAIAAQDWVNKYEGYIVHNVGGVGRVLKTVSGGYFWETLDGFTANNSGLVDIYACASDLVFTVGPVNSGSGFLSKIGPA